VSSRIPARRTAFATPELDAEIEAVRAATIVMWRGEGIPFARLPERIGRTDDRGARDRLYGSYADALEALNPVLERRLAAWQAAGDVVELAAAESDDPRLLEVELERFSQAVETPYFAALRRYLAQVDIEQGDASEADIWYVTNGAVWGSWFGARDVQRATQATGRGSAEPGDADGWLGAEQELAGGAVQPGLAGPGIVAEAYRSLAGAPDWVADELAMTAGEVPAYVDFAAFVRLWRMRRDVALLTYELRLFSSDDVALERAYYSGIVGHATGVAIAEAGYLEAVERPFACAERLRKAIMAGMLAESLERRLGTAWWRSADAAPIVDAVGAAKTDADVLAVLGYDALDWRPVMRQIRTRLIGEMSGYGGPNITTRAGTRKV
jgi:hypothetical protein